MSSDKKPEEGSPKTNARYSFELELSGAHASKDVPTTYTGTAFQGRLQLTFHEALTVERFSVKLFYRVSGSGSPETHELSHFSFDVGVVKAAQSLAKRISLSVPENAPMSYEGSYIKIVWSVSLELWLASQECFVEHVPVLVLPRPVDFDLHASPKNEAELEQGFIRISNIQPKLELPDLDPARMAAAMNQPQPAITPSEEVSPVPVAPNTLSLDIVDPQSEIDSSDILPIPEEISLGDVMDLPDEDPQ